MKDHIGDPVPRGTIGHDAPLVEEAIEAKKQAPADDVADAVSALKAEVERLTGLVAERQAEAAAQARAVVRDHPLTSLIGAGLIGYGVALVLHGHHDDRSRWYR